MGRRVRAKTMATLPCSALMKRFSMTTHFPEHLEQHAYPPLVAKLLCRYRRINFELARIGGQVLVHGFLRHCNRGGVSPRTPHASGKAKSCSLSHSHYFRVSCKSEQQLRSSAMSLLARFIKEDCGATAIEYGLIAALIA